MDICPHGFRHAMASKALLRKLLNQKELMVRLRVSQPATVRRYDKDGKLQRQMTILGCETRPRGEALVAGTSDKTNPAIRLFSVLKKAEALRRQRSLLHGSASEGFVESERAHHKFPPVITDQRVLGFGS